MILSLIIIPLLIILMVILLLLKADDDNIFDADAHLIRYFNSLCNNNTKYLGIFITR